MRGIVATKTEELKLTFISKTFEEFTPQELETLQEVPPTAEAIGLAVRIGKTMGSYAYPGDMVLQSIAYEAEKHKWSNEISSIIGNLAYEGMQRGYFD